jgi:hypothetical protein
VTTALRRTRTLIECEIAAATFALREADAREDFAEADQWNDRRDELLEELVPYLPAQR